jgi:hypothetical protein
MKCSQRYVPDRSWKHGRFCEGHCPTKRRFSSAGMAVLHHEGRQADWALAEEFGCDAAFRGSIWWELLFKWYTRWTLLSRRSRPRIAAPRLAVGRSGRQPLGAGDAAVAAGIDGRIDTGCRSHAPGSRIGVSTPFYLAPALPAHNPENPLGHPRVARRRCRLPQYVAAACQSGS